MAITRVESYNPTDMSVISSDVTELDFGGIIKGKFCSQTAVIKPIIEGNITALALFLENNGGFDHARFNYYASHTVACDVVPGDPRLSDSFIVDNDVSDFSTSDDGVILDNATPEYIWLDVKVGTASAVGAGTANYRFVFEYN